MGYAKDWGVKPSFLGLCAPEDDPYLMIAYSHCKSVMDSYDYQKQDEEIQRQARKGRRH